jgi:hypothetical protein
MGVGMVVGGIILLIIGIAAFSYLVDRRPVMTVSMTTMIF